MLFSKFFARRRLNSLRALTSNQSQYSPCRQLCEAIIDELSNNNFTNYNAVHGSSTFIHSAFPTIEEYTQTLRVLVRLLTKEGYALPISWGVIEDHAISIDRFLTSKSGHYVNAQEAVNNFKEAASQLCMIMEDSDTINVGVPEHNLRILTQLFVNIRNVTLQLIEVSLM